MVVEPNKLCESGVNGQLCVWGGVGVGLYGEWNSL